MSEPDIVERLRFGLQIDNGNPATGRPPTHFYGPMLGEAADEIERLRAAAIVDADRLRYGLQIEQSLRLEHERAMHYTDIYWSMVSKRDAQAIVNADRIRRATMPIPPEPEPDPC